MNRLENLASAMHWKWIHEEHHEGAHTYRAECLTCGWTGPIEPIRESARRDADEHIATEYTA